MTETAILRYSDKWDSVRFTADGLYVRFQEFVWKIPPESDRWVERLWNYRGPAVAWDADERGLYVENDGEIRFFEPGKTAWAEGKRICRRYDVEWQSWRLMGSNFLFTRTNDVVRIPCDFRTSEVTVARGEVRRCRHVVTPQGVYYERDGLQFLPAGETVPQLAMEIKKSKAKKSVHSYDWDASELGLFAVRSGILRQIAPDQPNWDNGRILHEGRIDRLFATPHGLFISDNYLVYRINLDP